MRSFRTGKQAIQFFCSAASFSLRGGRVPSKVLFTAKHLTVFGLFRIALSKRRGEKNERSLGRSSWCTGACGPRGDRVARRVPGALRAVRRGSPDSWHGGRTRKLWPAYCAHSTPSSAFSCAARVKKKEKTIPSLGSRSLIFLPD